MKERSTTLFGRRIGTNERQRREERARKLKHAFGCVWCWFKRRGWIFGVVLAVLAFLAIHNRFYLQRFNPLERRYLQ